MRYALLWLGIASVVSAADITVLEADARLRTLFALARDANDPALMDKIVATRDHVKRSFDRGDTAAVKVLLRGMEENFDIADDGATMFGQPIAKLTGKQRVQFEKLQEELNEAFAANDDKTARDRLQKLQELLETQAGRPDQTRKSELPKKNFPLPDDPALVFLKALQADPMSLKVLQKGTVGPSTLPRAYAAVILGCLPVRGQLLPKHEHQQALLDSTVTGCCTALVTLQLKSGFFKYPDLRDKHVRFTSIIQGLVAKDINAVQEGWVTLPDPLGETHYDVGESGIALLRASVAFKNDAWKQAGLKAADWMIQQPPCAVFHHNAYMVSLLCEAYRVTKDTKYRAAAWKKYDAGLVPGQLPSGRWFTPEDARAANTFTILRALHDLYDIADASERPAVQKVATKALQALLPEMVALLPPPSAYTLQELQRHVRFFPDTAKELAPHLSHARTLLLARSWRGDKAFAVVPLPELAATLTK